MARHKEKDDEAGGEGLGKLLTRKRLWRDSTGAIVSKKRPEHEKERKQSSHPRSTTSTLINQVARADSLPSLSPQSDLPLSPRSLDLRPMSNGSEIIDPLLLPSSSPDKRQMPVAEMVNSWPASHENPSHQEGDLDSLEFLCNGTWGTDAPSTDNNIDSLYNGTLSSDLGKETP